MRGGGSRGGLSSTVVVRRDNYHGRVLTTDQKGAIAESAIIHEAIKLGIDVFKPLSDGERYDLIFDMHPRLLRVQCKWAVRRGEVVVVRCFSCHRRRNVMVRRRYTPEEVDAIAAYCADVNRCYLIPLDRLSSVSTVYLRLSPTRNNQRRGVVWADDFAFGRLHSHDTNNAGP